ncbi:MAG: glycine cleavage system protein GcvH [SAR202 cluster bacterium]|nr:glycine cleavage system protein GcvH [SAR202 cluster bacterium]|tara:strand:- start:11280 stop:11669 length:390 start_codon:yes stop_codon:yes gene_type:complete
MYPNDRKYSKEHEWAKQDINESLLIGITDYAQEHLGDIVYLDLPNVGSMLSKMQKLGEIESVKSVSDIFSPVSGEVIEINNIALDSPELVNSDPHNNGWLVRIIVSNASEFDELLTADEYQSFLDSLGS